MSARCGAAVYPFSPADVPPDGDYDDPGAGAVWLRDAVDAVLGGAEPSRAETKPVGCSIKWKP